MSGVREPMGLKLYRAASRAGKPLTDAVLQSRLKKGKEDPARIHERRGETTTPRPEGAVIWIHGASVGESLSILPLVSKLNEKLQALHILVTTGTITSAKLMAERLPQNATHQFVPLDHPTFIAAFLDHWKPDAVFFVESELWPNLIVQTRKATSYMALINGRMSPKSFADWQSQPNAIRFLLSSFDLIIGQDKKNADRLHALAGRPVRMFGNLKNAAPPLPSNDADIAQFSRSLGERKRWLSASTHPGEEGAVISAHKILRRSFPDLLSIIAPRHPERGAEIAKMLTADNVPFAQRSAGDAISDQTEVYLADTLGELGLFYRLCAIAFVGGSITAKGGHNPLEPARLGAAILHGPETFNFGETYDDMRKVGGAALVRNDREMAAAVKRLLSDVKTQSAMSAAARAMAERNAQQTLEHIVAALLEGMPKSIPRHDA